LTDKDDWYERVILRKISIYITKLFIKSGRSADFVTMVSFVFGIIGVILLCLGSKVTLILGCVSLQLWYLLDKCDGEVARYRRYQLSKRVEEDKLESELNGVLLDNVLHYLIHSLIFASVCIGVFRQFDYLPVICFGFSAALSSMFLNLIVQLKDSIIFNKMLQIKAVIKFSRSKGSEGKESYLHRIFSLMHYICTFPFVLNMLTLSAAANLLLGRMSVWPLAIFIIFYGCLIPFVWITKFIFYIRERRIDFEFAEKVG